MEIGPDGELRPATAGFTEVPMDLGGRVINVYTFNYLNFNYWADIDATPNETLEVIEKLREIEEDYNMKFEFEQAPRGGAAVQALMMDRVVGDHNRQIFNINIFHTSPDLMFVENVVMDMYDERIAHIINFDANPWNPGSLMSRMWDRQHGVHFTLANSGEILSSVLTFNRDFMELYNLGNFHEMVFNYTWNFTNFERILRETRTASNGRVIPLVSHREQFIAPGFIFANGGLIIDNTPGGLVFVGPTNDRALEAINYLATLHQENLLRLIGGSHPDGVTVHEILERSASGEILMMSGEYDLLRVLTRQEVPTEYSFGLLPTPMGDHMTDYVAAMIRFDMFYIVNDQPNPEQTAAVLVAMANRLTKLNYLEHELNFGLQDMDSARVFEMMMERQVIDYSRMTSARNRTTDSIVSAIRGEQTPVQALTAVENTINGILAGLQPR
jgi:hypothetical protein